MYKSLKALYSNPPKVFYTAGKRFLLDHFTNEIVLIYSSNKIKFKYSTISIFSVKYFILVI